MKQILTPFVFFLIIGTVFFVSCKKEPSKASPYIYTPPPPPPPPPAGVTVSCDNRPVINARLVPVGFLSEGRIGLVSGTVGSKILFAGGMVPGAYSPRVDIYDTITHTWSTANLTIAERQGMAVATVGTKIFFAGGEDADVGTVTSRIDIYDVATNIWSTAELSAARDYLAAVTADNKIFFAGGGLWGPISGGIPNPNWPPNANYHIGSDVVDVYDNATNSWSVIHLSEGRYELSATVTGSKIYFAGGINNIFNISTTIDIFDAESNSWSTSQLHEPKTGHASIATDNKIFWASGARKSYWNGYELTNTTEILDLSSGTTSYECITPKNFFKAVMKDSLIIFFTGNMRNDPFSGTHFEIYNRNSKQWSTGLLSKRLNDATIISVNNTIYVAGGRDNAWGPYFKDVWKLEF